MEPATDSAPRAARHGRASLGSFLRAVEPFSKVRPGWLRRVEKLVDEVELEADEILFRAGQPGDAVYFVRRGRV